MAEWAQTPSDAVHPFGTGLFWAAYDTAVGSPAPAVGTALSTASQSWTELGKLVRVTTPERSSGDTKITHLKSPNKAHEYIPGYVDGGLLTYRIHHSPAAMAAIEALAPDATTDEQRLAWAVQLANGVIAYHNGFVKSYPQEVTDGDDPVAIDVTVRCSGDLFIVYPA
jgi:hypothetical protein